eukprot:305238-Rhodomonas_salina.2
MVPLMPFLAAYLPLMVPPMPFLAAIPRACCCYLWTQCSLESAAVALAHADTAAIHASRTHAPWPFGVGLMHHGPS